MILVIPLYALCAMTFTLAKAALSYSLPFFYVGIRMVAAGALLYGGYHLTNQKTSLIKSKDWFLFFQIILFNVYIAYCADLWSLQYITSIESSLIFNMSPFIAALFSYLWFGELMTPKKWCGLLLGASSILPLLFLQGDSRLFFDGGRIIPIAVLIGSVISSAYGWIIMRELVGKRSYSPIMVNGIGMLGGGIAALITSFFLEPWSPLPVTSWSNFLFFTGAIIITANILFANFYAYLLKHYTATLLSFAGFLCPVFATFLGWFFLDEPMSWRFFFSFLTVTGGLYLFYQEELRQGYVKQ